MTNTETSCRDLIDWGTLVGAALGLPYRKVFECLNGTMGQVYGVVTARQTLPAASTTRPRRPSTAEKTGAEALAQNLTTLLQPTPEELVRYGVNVQGVDATIVNFAKTLITFKKSVERNLTGSVVVQAAPGDDPHDADPAGGGTRQHKLTWTALATVWKQFTTDMLAAKMDFLATIAGDTTKSLTSSSGWPDGLSQNGDLSMMFVLDTTGHVKPGIFGSYGPGVVNRAISFNAATGAPDPTTPADPAATAALSACVSAIVRKDSNLPAGIALGNVRGLTRPRIDGPTPDQHRGITGG